MLFGSARTKRRASAVRSWVSWTVCAAILAVGTTATEARAQAGPTLDASVRQLSDELARALKRLPGDHRDQVFAVLPFMATGAKAKSQELGVVVADLVLTNLVRDHRLPLVERSRLGQVLDEQSLEGLGLVSADGAAEIGRITGATAVIVGEVAEVGETVTVNARVIDASTADVLTASSVSLPADALIAVAADAVVLKSRAGALFRSALIPGWGQMYNGDSARAGLVGGTVATLLGVTLLTAAASAGVYALYTQTVPAEGETFTAEDAAQVTQLGQMASALAGGAAVMATFTAAAWGAGAADAYFTGTDVDSLDDATVR